jgi:hypothetical protein
MSWVRRVVAGVLAVNCERSAGVLARTSHGVESWHRVVVVPSFPPRLHVLLAKDAPVAVVIRPGPSKAVCTMLWNRTTDEFSMGQWMRGRIYEKRSDLAPDGKHLIYLAFDARNRSPGIGSAWTAISRAPYLKAIVLISNGETYDGGGLFRDNERYWFNEGIGPRDLPKLRLCSSG